MSIADPWAVSGGTDSDVPAEALPQNLITPQIRGRIQSWLAVLCFAGVAVLNVVWALQPYGSRLAVDVYGHQHEYDFPGPVAENSVFFLAAVATAVLLAVPRTRAFATSFGIGFSMLWFATDFMELRIPKTNPLVSALAQVGVYGSNALALPVLILLLWAARSRAKAAREAQLAAPAVAPAPDRERRARWSVALVLGLVGAAASIVGTAMSWVRTTMPADPFESGSKATSRTCCSFSQLTGYGRIDMVCGSVALLLLTVIATTMAGRRFGLSAYGLLAGALPVLLSPLTVVAAQVWFPLESEFGMQNPILFTIRLTDSPDSFVLKYAPVLGLWPALAGFVLLIVVTVHLATRRARAVEPAVNPAINPAVD